MLYLQDSSEVERIDTAAARPASVAVDGVDFVWRLTIVHQRAHNPATKLQMAFLWLIATYLLGLTVSSEGATFTVGFSSRKALLRGNSGHMRFRLNEPPTKVTCTSVVVNALLSARIYARIQPMHLSQTKYRNAPGLEHHCFPYDACFS